MLKDIRDGKISRVVVWHQDRLHRDVMELWCLRSLPLRWRWRVTRAETQPVCC